MLKFFVTLIILGDAEQCLLLDKTYFIRRNHLKSRFSSLFLANLLRIRGFAILDQDMRDPTKD